MTPFQNPSNNRSQWVFSLNALRYSHAFGLLFSHPKLACALLAMRPFWGKTILTAILLCIVGSLILTMNTIPEYGTDISQGTEFVLNTLDTVKFANGTITWPEEKDAQLPATANMTHLRMDIVKSWSDFVVPSSSIRQQGVVLCSDGIGYWAKGESGELMISELLMPAEKVRNLPEEALVLTKDKKTNFCKFAFWTLLTALFFAQTIALLKTLFLTGFVLTFAWLLIGRIRPLKGFGRFLSIAVNLCLPPFIVAIFWSAMNIPGDFESLFTLLFFIYLVYACIEGRRGQFLPAQP